MRKLSTKFKPTKPVIFLGDSEFDGVTVQHKLKKLDWFYVLRTSPNLYIYPANAPDGIRLGDLVPSVDSPEQTLQQVRFTDKHRFGPLDCFACWESPHTEALILIYHLPENWGYSPRTTYKTRFWTEPLFRDFKEGGFRLSTARLEDSDRIDTLFLAISSAYLWMISLGAALIATGDTSLVDHSNHRTLSVFKTGWRWFKRQLKLGDLFLFNLILPKHFVLPSLFFKHTWVG